MIDRHERLLGIVNERRRVEVAELSALLGVSQVTIRKDLAELARQGFLTRAHGYAAAIVSEDIVKRLSVSYPVKDRIAQAAAKLVENGETIMIESGSCCALLAEELAATKRDVTIVTNSVFIADRVRESPNLQIVLLGGNYQKGSEVLVGPILKRCAEQFYVGKMFAGTDGFSEKTGFTGDNHLRTEAVRALAAQADQIIVLAESGKFQRKGVVTEFSPDEVDYLFTDRGIPPEAAALLASHGVKIDAES